MFEIIPNWHPILVHFAIALLTISVIFFVLLKVMSNHSLKEQIRTMAYWNLWLGTGFAVVTAIAGWFAYNSVAHDTPSHIAMTEHKNWALITLSVFIILSIWSVKLYKSISNESSIFTLTMVLAFVLLASTGWRGSELVYRYGLGVISIPQAEGDGHGHDHEHSNTIQPGSTQDHHDTIVVPENKVKAPAKKAEDDHSDHDHKH
ncbi:MAG: DUF2231 domain-containing protein [Gammaproteobacteria bacterium]|nr:DUF2231 domain-containing protein [Gammaproteobacteria bacterium]